ncbi:MAG: GAF domain-containing protein, partial [Cyanobacteria bacterium J06623_5]
ENVYPQGPDELFWDLLYEWNSPVGMPGISALIEQFPFPASAFPEDTVSLPLSEGKSVQFLTRDLEGVAADMNKATSVKSLIGVPIFINNSYWGSIGFDDCTVERVWSEAEVAVLETAAACVGSAIERDLARREREAAAQARAAALEAHNQALAERDRILEATAVAANVMLTAADFSSAVGEAIALIGEGLAVDRVGLMQHFEATEGDAFGYHEIVCEWAATGLSLQNEHPEYNKISDNGVTFLSELLRGEVAGGVVGELPEPFRSSQIEMGVKSIYAVPVMVEGDYWGAIGLDDCHNKTRRSEAELEALMTLANCIGSAIEQERNRQAREAAERRVLVEREQAAQARAQQLAQSNEVLELRDRWLSATAEATEELLSANELEQAIQPALKTIGETIGVDRIGIMYASEQEGQKVLLFLDEWVHSSQPVQSEHEELFSVPCDIIGEEHLKALLRGDPYGGDIEDFPDPFRSSQKEIGVQSTYSVPIVIDGRFWGLVGIDHCREKKLLIDTEIAVFQTIASCFASAIQRDQIRKEREAAEREAIVERERAARAAELEAANKVLRVRDRWLQTTAIAANELLSATDTTASVQKALATIGENLECDRLSVMQHILTGEVAKDNLGLMRTLHEWDAEGIAAQGDHPDLKDIPADGIEDWFETVLAGQTVSGLLEELEEPFRSSMESLGVKSTYAVPVLVEGKLWGIVGMDYCRVARRLSAAELAVFQTAASCVGSAIYQAQARRDRAAQERARLLGSVAEAANLLLRSADYEQVLPEVTRLLGEAVGSDRCSVSQDIVLESSGDLAVRVLEEWIRENIAVPTDVTPESFPADNIYPIAGDFLRIHQTLTKGEVVNFLVSDLTGEEKAFLEAQGNTSMLIVPIMVQNKIWGSIGFDNCGEPRLYDDAEIAILQVAAESIAAAIARQAQEDSVREAEKRYRTLFEVSSEGIFRLGLDEPISRSLPIPEQIKLFYERAYGAEANKAFAAMYGYQNPEDMLGWRLTDIHLEGSEQNADYMHQVFASPEGRVSNIESQELDADGTVHYFLNNSICTIENGFIVGGWGSQTDITELKKAQIDREEAEKAVLAERERAAREQAAELAKTNEAIGRTLSTLAANPELDNFLCLLVKELSEVVGAHNTGLFLYNAEDDTLYRHIAYQDGKAYIGAVPRDTEMLQSPFPANITDAWRLILDSPQPVTFADTGTPEDAPNNFWWKESIDWHISEGHKEIACARLRVGNIPLGFIGFCFREHRTFSAAQFEVIQALANQATLAIQFTRLAEEAKQSAILQEQEKAAQERAAELAKTNEAIAQTLTTLAASPELDQFLGTILAEMSKQLNAAKVHLFLYDQPTNTLTRRVVIQNGQVYLGSGPNDPEMFSQPIPADMTPGWDCLLSDGKSITYDETQPIDEEIWWPETIAWHKAQGHKVATCIPLKAGNVPIGFIGYAFYDRTRLTDEQLEFMQALANQAIVAIQLTRLGEEAKQAAILQTQERAAQERAAQLSRSNQALKRSLDSLAQQPELEAFLQGVVNEVATQTGADSGQLFLYDAETRTWSLRVSTDNNGDWRNVPDMKIWLNPISVDEAPNFWAKLSEQREAFIMQDVPNTLKPGPDVWEPSIAWHLQRG